MIQTIVDALALGGLHALTALGVGLIFSVMRLANFAHGELITCAGYAMLAVSGQPLLMVLGFALLVVVALSMTTERLAFRSLRGADPATLLIASFTVSIFLQKLLVFVETSRVKPLDPLPMLGRPVLLFGAQVSLLKLVTIAVCASLLLALVVLLKKTPIGQQMRAAAEDFTMARLVGVRADRVILFAFAISGVLALAVAVMFVAQSGFVQPRMGVQLVMIGFVATVIGGLGSLPGAVLGGFLVGVLATCLQAFLPEPLRPFREALLFGIVILILLVRPDGLLPARSMKERV